MDAKEFEDAVLNEFSKYNNMRDPWFILLFIMYSICLFCNDLPGSGLYVRFLTHKYRVDRHQFDIAFFVICKVLIGTMADLYGRRRVCRYLSTAACLIFIPASISLDFHISIAHLVLRKMHYYIMPSLTMVFFVNFIELCKKFSKIASSVWLLCFACATETLMLPMPPIYRNTIMIPLLTIPVFISWYMPESSLWLLNKNKSQDVLEHLKEISGKRPAIAPPKLTDDVDCSKFRIWKESMRYLFTQQWRKLLITVALSFVTGFCITQVSFFTVLGTVPIRIPLSLFSIFIIVVVYICLGLRIGIMFLNGALCLSEIVHLILLLASPSVLIDGGLIFIWFQYVLVWATDAMTLLLVVDSFPTFVRAITTAAFLMTQHVVTAVLQIIGIDHFPLDSIYVSCAKILVTIILGIVPLVFLEETSRWILPNQKLQVS